MNSQSLFTEISQELHTSDEVQTAKMFGIPSLKIAGKAFACLYQDDMVFKLRGQAHAEALSLEGSGLFDPMGGRPMKEWVQVPRVYADHWRELARQALALQREANK